MFYQILFYFSAYGHNFTTIFHVTYANSAIIIILSIIIVEIIVDQGDSSFYLIYFAAHFSKSTLSTAYCFNFTANYALCNMRAQPWPLSPNINQSFLQ